METKKYKLPKRFLAKWLVALRSGDYLQGQGLLYNKETNGFCCLGVAGAICGNSLEKMDGQEMFRIEDAEVPKSVVPNKKFPQELKYQTIHDDDNEFIVTLACMNDGNESAEGANPTRKKYTFPEIADWLETNVESY